MIKPSNYETTTAERIGEQPQLPPGAYTCVIKNAIDTKTKAGDSKLELWLDIADGEYKDFIEKQYNFANERFGNAYWRGTYNQLTSGKSLRFFKGLIEDIEASNPGYTFNFDEKTLVGKKIGGVFRREEYENKNGENKFSTKCYYCVKTTDVKNFKAPEDKLLDKTKVNNNSGVSYVSDSGLPMEEIGDDDSVPF